MRVLNRKLWRDLRHLRGQTLAIGLVISAGLGTFVMSLSTLDSLRLTQETFYRDYRFGEVFVEVAQAPRDLTARMGKIPGVLEAETRVSGFARIRVKDFPEEVGGFLVSIPDDGRAALNQVFLRSGRLPDPRQPNEAVVGEAFAEAHDLQVGDTVEAVIDGRQETLRLVGIGLSPDFIYQFAPGVIFPGHERFGVYWMAETPLSRALDMQGAWNQGALALTPGTDPRDVIAALDAVLEPYGGLGAYPREEQASHEFLMEEFAQLEQLAGVFSIIFLGVAAFLLNIVMNRLISLEREQIATLKAFGYRNREVGAYYAKLVLLLVSFGIVGGILLGMFMGNWLADVYMQYFRFPFLVYRLDFATAFWGIAGVMFAALLGTWRAVRRSMRLAPAQAMQPEPPPVFRRTLIERLGMQRFLSRPSRMILRNLERRPLKGVLSVAAMGLSCAIVILGAFFIDALDHLIDVEFRYGRHESFLVPLTENTHARALHETVGIPGIAYAEGFRFVPVRLRSAQREVRTALEGHPRNARLRRIVDTEMRIHVPPEEGLLLSQYLAESLGVAPGDTLRVEVLEGRRPVKELPVTGLVDQFMGTAVYMEIDALNRLLNDGNLISNMSLAVDAGWEDAVAARLEGYPRVAATVAIGRFIADFYETIGDTLLIYAGVLSLFASFIAFGVIYNAARISLSERSRELASMRVLGFTRGEISYILLGELAVIALLAIPVGFLMGRGLATYLIDAFATEMIRIPLVISPATYALAALVVLLSTLISAVIVRRRLNRLDLVEVLKTRE